MLQKQIESWAWSPESVDTLHLHELRITEEEMDVLSRTSGTPEESERNKRKSAELEEKLAEREKERRLCSHQGGV